MYDRICYFPVLFASQLQTLPTAGAVLCATVRRCYRTSKACGAIGTDSVKVCSRSIVVEEQETVVQGPGYPHFVVKTYYAV